MRWAGTTNSFCFKVVDRAILIPVQMQTLRRNLSEMNFHASNPRILSAKFRAQRLGNTSRNKTGDIPAEARDFLNNARTSISVFLLRHEENCFYRSIQFPVH